MSGSNNDILLDLINSGDDIPLSEMTMEQAYIWGSNKNRGETEWVYCSPKLWLQGLHGALKMVSASLGAGSLSQVTKALGWHVLALWNTVPSVAECKNEHTKTQQMVVNTLYTDLNAALLETVNFRLSSPEPTSKQRHIYLHKNVHGALSSLAEAIGLDMTTFIQVGLGWSLSTSSKLSNRSNEFFMPEVQRVIELTKTRSNEFLEIRGRVVIRDLLGNGSSIEINGTPI